MLSFSVFRVSNMYIEKSSVSTHRANPIHFGNMFIINTRMALLPRARARINNFSEMGGLQVWQREIRTREPISEYYPT